jgi:hypothetical protein
MFLIRDIMDCKPGEARPMVEGYHDPIDSGRREIYQLEK